MPARRSTTRSTAAGRSKLTARAPAATSFKKQQQPSPPKLAVGQQKKIVELVDVDDAEVIDDDDKVVAEFGVHVLRGPSGSSIDRYAFEQEQPARMESCGGRLKRSVKHAEFTYKSKRRADGVPINKKAAMYDGVYEGESYTKYSELLREAAGFFKDDRLYLLPIDDAYELRRKLIRPAELNLTEQNKLADETFHFVPRPPVPQVVRIRYARPETDWQRRRREQSAYYRAMLFEQDPWVECEVEKKHVESVFDDQLTRAETSTAAIIESPSRRIAGD